MDIFCIFLTSVYDSKGAEVKNSHIIAHLYVTSKRFYIDVLTVIGSEFFTAFVPSLRFFALFKVARIFRLGAMI